MTARPIDEARLAALADGELPAGEAAEVEAAAASDPALAEQLRRLRELRAAVSGAYEDAMTEPVPERLQRAARGGDVVDFAAARSTRRPVSQRLAQWAALAASLAAAFAIGRLAPPLSEPPASVGTDASGALTARGPLAAALQSQLASAQVADAPVKIGVSFRAADGRYCRTFTLRRGASIAGLACRAPDAWRIQLAMAAPPTAAATYQTAGEAAPAPVLEAMDRMIAGAPLDAAGEANAKAAGWRAKP